MVNTCTVDVVGNLNIIHHAEVKYEVRLLKFWHLAQLLFVHVQCSCL